MNVWIDENELQEVKEKLANRSDMAGVPEKHSQWEPYDSIPPTDKMSNWISVNLPENCPNVCISFKREIAEMQIEKFGAKPLYGLDRLKENWLPMKVFITYGGTLAPGRRRPEV